MTYRGNGNQNFRSSPPTPLEFLSPMPFHTCLVCGAHYPGSPGPPPACVICSDERQYVGAGGSGRQEWATSEELLQRSHCNVTHELDPGLLSISMEPKVGIGQQAILVETPEGNILWDCLPVLHPDTASELKKRGGVKAIAVSHPHFYTGMADWAEALDCPIYIHQRDARWVTRPSPRIQLWEGEQFPVPGLPDIVLHRLGGHFPGSAVLHWRHGQGCVLTGDSVLPTPDGHVSFMFSFPNLLPLPADVVARIGAAVEALPPFERLYGAFPSARIASQAKAVVLSSADRYCAILSHGVEREYF